MNQVSLASPRQWSTRFSIYFPYNTKINCCYATRCWVSTWPRVQYITLVIADSYCLWYFLKKKKKCNCNPYDKVGRQYFSLPKIITTPILKWSSKFTPKYLIVSIHLKYASTVSIETCYILSITKDTGSDRLLSSNSTCFIMPWVISLRHVSRLIEEMMSLLFKKNVQYENCSPISSLTGQIND